MSPLELREGVLFGQRYQIVRCIAMGGMGAVYEVVHVETDRRRALKLMLPSCLHNADMRQRFRQEARVTARVQSEYLVDVLDAGIDEATQMPFLVMELLSGEELSKRIERLGALTAHDVVTYITQTAIALDKTHQASIVHRDLKPGNLFLTEREDGSPRIKILDFGIAKIVAEGSTGPVSQALGTPLYMSPEQFQLGLKVSPAADIFALGMIAYTLLVGSPYWREEARAAANIYAFIAAAAQGPVEPATARAGRQGVSLPPAFDAWFAKVTAFAPHDRYATASAAAIALGEVFGIAVPHRVSSAGAAPARISQNPAVPSRSSSPGFSPSLPRASEMRPSGPPSAPAKTILPEAAAPLAGLASTSPVKPRETGVLVTVIGLGLASAAVTASAAFALLWNRDATEMKAHAAPATSGVQALSSAADPPMQQKAPPSLPAVPAPLVVPEINAAGAASSAPSAPVSAALPPTAPRAPIIEKASQKSPVARPGTLGNPSTAIGSAAPAPRAPALTYD
ncbi:MAG: protein kinase [Polyangiaceae bacterium]|nr:protein kinase [Polyangiaceae bacterium]